MSAETARNAASEEEMRAAAAAGEVFLSYHSPDRAALLQVRELLGTRGVGTFLDRDNLLPGMPWPQALERALAQAQAVAVFLGPHGIGLWQKREIGYALDRQVREEEAGRAFPVIPVLLPGTDPSPGFLFLNTWIDLRRDVGAPELIDALAAAIRGNAPGAAAETALALCPYRGFKPFTEEDRGIFFGREAEIPRLLEACLRHRFVCVVGPSGSGKSSLVHAGLLPLLRAQHPPNATWDMASFVPTDQPFHQLSAALIGMLEPELGETDRIAEAKKLGDRLAAGEASLEAVVTRALAKSGGSDRLLLVVDQFEELFNRTGERERKALVTMLLGGIERAPLTVLITLRASFHAHLGTAFPELAGHLQRGSVSVEPMSRDAMRRAVVEPARRVALEFEQGLVERVLDDLSDEPGNLALLEFALTRLWDKRRNRTLTHAAYVEIKSIKGAIAQRAEEFYSALTAEQQAQVRRVLTQLWAVSGRDDRQGTRRRALTAELGEEYWPIIKALADARLVVTGSDPATGRDTVEIAHDALIRDWQRLKAWLDEDRDFLVWRTRLFENIAEWEAAARAEARLLHGAQIDEARDWRRKHPEVLTPTVTEYIARSAALRERELMTRVRTQRRLILAAASAALLFLVVAVLAYFQWQQVDAQRDILHSRDVATKALGELSIDPDLAMQIAIRALDTASTPEAQEALRKALQESRVRAVLRGHSNVVTTLAVSGDGRRVVTASTDHTVRVWDAASGKLVRMLGAGAAKRIDFAPVQRLVFSPQGRRFLSVGADGAARIWDVDSEGMRGSASGPAGAVLDAAWVRDEDAPLVLSAGAAGTAVLWNAVSGAEIGQALVQPGGIGVVEVSRDGRRIATGGAGGTVRVWDALGKPVSEFDANGKGITALAFSPDGASLAVGTEDGRVRVLDMLRKNDDAVLGSHSAAVTRVAFSPDGRRLASASRDNSVRIWDPVAKRLLEDLRKHTDSVDYIAFSADGRHLASGGADGLCIVWDLATGLIVAELRGHTDLITGVAFRPGNGSGEKSVVTISRDHTARIWAAVTSQDWTVLRGHTGAVDEVQFSPDGSRLLSAGGDNAPRIWDVSRRKLDHVLHGHTDSILAARFSPDGKLAVTASRDYTARVWDSISGKQIAELKGHTDWVRDAHFSPDSSLVVTASNDMTARVWDARSGELRARPLRGHSDRIYTAVFSPDGRLVATGSADHTARIWDLVTGGVLVLKGHEGGIRSVAFSPNGKLLATASDDGSVRVWQVWSGTNLAVLHHSDSVRTVEFNKDGTSLLTASWDGTARIWDVASFALRRTLGGQASKLSAAAFSPDGKLVATVDWDGVGRTYESATGAVVCGLIGHQDRILGVAFSPDSKLIATASRDTTVRLWAADLRAVGDEYPCEPCGSDSDVLKLAKQRVTRALTPYEERRYLDKAPKR